MYMYHYLYNTTGLFTKCKAVLPPIFKIFSTCLVYWKLGTNKLNEQNVSNNCVDVNSNYWCFCGTFSKMDSIPLQQFLQCLTFFSCIFAVVFFNWNIMNLPLNLCFRMFHVICILCCGISVRPTCLNTRWILYYKYWKFI